MDFIIGFAVWFVIGAVCGVIARSAYPADHTVLPLAITFGVFGAFIGGMLGSIFHVHHNAVPLRLGGLAGAISGGFLFPFIYQFMGRKFV
jgi:uncharacterized membrane protein YeaQ/YmgE (transglycosylase-associated protein family)